MTTPIQATIEQIAKDHLGLETLATRKRDSLDFHELAVWSIKVALEAAYAAGARDGFAARKSGSSARGGAR